jgi:hypothetical protein
MQSWPCQETAFHWGVTIAIGFLTTELLAVLGQVRDRPATSLRTHARLLQRLFHSLTGPGEKRSSRPEATTNNSRYRLGAQMSITALFLCLTGIWQP